MITSAGLSDRITLHGLIPRSEVLKLMSVSDFHIITSMNEANTTVIWEAMGAGVPTLSLDHCGMHDTICEACGVLIPLSDYRNTCEAVAVELDRVIKEPEALAIKQMGVLACAKNHMWGQRAKAWLQIYDEAIKSHAMKKLGSRS
jgi:glycosyltransferase involved in cell wall biosynthesis